MGRAGLIALALAGGTPSVSRAVVAQDLPLIKVPVELRVVVGSVPFEAPVGGASSWRLIDAWSRMHAQGTTASWRIERRERRLRGSTLDGARATAWSDEPFGVVPGASGAFVTWRGKRYRGELRYVATDTAIVVVNVVPLEEYLRGVVPLEIGGRRADEVAAVEAQAIAARSYTVVRALEGVTRAWDLTAAANDQVYGGVDAESAMGDEAIRATRGIVLAHDGRVVRAPYHAVCGGTTAAPSEVWQGGGERYLQSVSDRDPATGRAWCELAPRYAWERVIDQPSLVEALQRHPSGRGTREVRAVRVATLTASGRVATLEFQTERGRVVLTGSEARIALRSSRGEMLNSTQFAVGFTTRDGVLSALTLRGHGNGHGVGMCQWGAIGRARAGHNAAAILAAYYPGTRLARVS